MLAVIALLLFSFVRVAQPVETWYFGQVRGDLVAYTAAGTQQPVAPDFGELRAGWRFDEHTALFLSTDSADVTHLYRATQDEATEIAVPGDPDLTNLRVVLDRSGDYALLWVRTPGQFPSMGILVNVPAGTAEVLTDRVAREARFDGSVLRYISVDEEFNWSLIERDLSSGEERAIHSFSTEANVLPFISANVNGSRWVYAMGVNRVFVSTLVNADGTTEVLEGGTPEQATAWMLFDEALLSYPILCQTDCLLTMHEGETRTEFTLPEGSPNIAVLAHPTPESLVIAREGNALLKLAVGAEPFSLGEYNPVSMLIGSDNLLSPDKRYLFSVIESENSVQETRFLVTNLVSGNNVFAGAGATATQVQWFERGFVVTLYGRDTTATAYYYEGQASLDLPNRDAGTYFDILPDGTLLYALNRDEPAIGAAGIYRYTPADESYTLLVESARIAYTPPIN